MLPHHLLEILHWFPSPPLLMHEAVLLIICQDSIILCTSSHSINEVYYWSYGVIEVHNIIWTWFLEIQIPFNVYYLYYYSVNYIFIPYLFFSVQDLVVLYDINLIFVEKYFSLMTCFYIKFARGHIRWYWYMVFPSLLLCLESSPLLNIVNYWLLVLLLNLRSILTHAV